jgi:hypothetical protein
MSDNFTTTDASSSTVTLSASDDGTSKAAKVVSMMAYPVATNTRPADTNAYAALDSVNSSTSSPTVLSFTGAVRANGMGGMITDACLVIDNKNSVAEEIHLWLFNASPTATNDNAAFAPSTGDSNKCIGHLIFTAANMSDGTNSRVYRAVNDPLVFQAGASTTTIYGVFQTRTAFTPTSAETWHVTLTIVQET